MPLLRQRHSALFFAWFFPHCDDPILTACGPFVTAAWDFRPASLFSSVLASDPFSRAWVSRSILPAKGLSSENYSRPLSSLSRGSSSSSSTSWSSSNPNSSFWSLAPSCISYSRSLSPNARPPEPTLLPDRSEVSKADICRVWVFSLLVESIVEWKAIVLSWWKIKDHWCKLQNILSSKIILNNVKNCLAVNSVNFKDI